AMPLVQTDYGLIYNTNGSLCVTLRPGEGRFGGAVAVEEGTTNLIPSNMLKFEGWSRHQGATVNILQGYGIPGVTDREATRIQTSGGPAVLKYYVTAGSTDGTSPNAFSVWVYNIGAVP